MGDYRKLECHFTVAADQGFLTEPAASELQQRIARIKRMLWNLIRRLRDQ